MQGGLWRADHNTQYLVTFFNAKTHVLLRWVSSCVVQLACTQLNTSSHNERVHTHHKGCTLDISLNHIQGTTRAVTTHKRYSRAWRDIFSERERARFWLLTDRFSFLLGCFFFLRILYVSTTLWHHFILAAASFHLVCWLLPNSYIIHNRSPMAFYVGVFFLLGVLVEFLIHFMFS